MDSLLRWSIENSAPNAQGEQPPVRQNELNPAIIDAILGKPDAEQMKEDIAIATDESRSEDDRVAALDHLEMLVEHIDNANDLEKLKMWEPLHQLLLSTSSSPTIKMQALWVIGTAVQNNPAAQGAYLAHQPLPILTAFLAPSPASTPQIRSKALYALSGLLKHNAVAVETLSAADLRGWLALKDGLQDADISVRRKIVFLLNTLITPTTPGSPRSSPSGPGIHSPTSSNQPVHANSHASMLSDPTSTATSPLALKAVKEHGLLSRVISSLVDPVPYGADGDQTDLDPDYEEKSIRLLHTYTTACNGQIPDFEKATLNRWFDEQERAAGGRTQLAEKWGLSGSELQPLLDATT
ncbi:hypothetical protein HGRIS_006922 [Hohenbuehelia grisea]|uniref:Nucleotide exchange factor Fes1 domain-containing protein n=1 Tax=Hohenbuehelia grisea TaxID=104357 RepID=A0ABR3JB09_9AGAR